MNPQNKTRELQHPIKYLFLRCFVKRNTIFTNGTVQNRARKKSPAWSGAKKNLT